MFNKNWWFLHFQEEFLNFSVCIRKLAVAFYMINEIQPKITFQNIVQCPFNTDLQRSHFLVPKFSEKPFSIISGWKLSESNVSQHSASTSWWEWFPWNFRNQKKSECWRSVLHFVYMKMLIFYANLEYLTIKLLITQFIQDLVILWLTLIFDSCQSYFWHNILTNTNHLELNATIFQNTVPTTLYI